MTQKHLLQASKLTSRFLLKCSTLAAQSIGMFISFAFRRIDVAITVGALYSNATMLFGGFFITKVPVWMHSLRFISVVHFGFLNMQIAEFNYGPPIACAQGNSKYSSCRELGGQQQANADHQLDLGSNISANSHRTPIGRLPGHYINNDELLLGADPGRPDELPYPMWFNTLCLVAFIVVFRLLGYLILRRYNKPG